MTPSPGITARCAICSLDTFLSAFALKDQQAKITFNRPADPNSIFKQNGKVLEQSYPGMHIDLCYFDCRSLFLPLHPLLFRWTHDQHGQFTVMQHALGH